MRNSWLVVLCLVILAGVSLGAASPSEGSGKIRGSYWYAVDNISLVEDNARIVIWATLPPDGAGQTVTVSGITPEPAAILEDPVSGNRVIEWVVLPQVRTPDPETKPTHQFFHYDFELEQVPIHFSIDPTAVEPHDTSSDLYRKYTSQETWIQTDGKILDQARLIIGQEKNAWIQGGLIYDWIMENLDFVPGGAGERDAKSVLEGKTGDCGQFSILYVALCRSVGIPARTVTYTWLDGGSHVFAELHIPGFGWVPVDASLGQMLMGDGGGMSREEVGAFMKNRGAGSDDPRWFYGNMADGRLINTLGNNIRFASPTLGETLTFQRLQPGGVDATPTASVVEGFNSTVIQGGFFVFDQDVPDEEAAHALVHQRLASSFFNVGLYDLVEDSCRKSLVKSGDSIQAWMNIGKVHMHKGEYYKAEAAFKRAISGVALARNEKMDALIWTHNYLGNCYDLLGHRDMALEEYQTVIELGSNYRGAVDYAEKYLERPFDITPPD